MFRCTRILHSKRLTIPQLSPTHTQARILQYLVPTGSEVTACDTVLVVECSSDFVTEAHRQTPDERVQMILETHDDGVIQWDNDKKKMMNVDDDATVGWLPVGTIVGTIDDGDPIDGDWAWQAYKHDTSEWDRKGSAE